MGMSSGYDKRTTTFNPDGRLLQVEYAIEHINQDASVIGILTKEGVVLAAEKKETSSSGVSMFIPTNESGKLYKLDDHIICSVSGITADANILVDMARLASKRHTYSQKTPMYVEEIVKHLANYKHSYTQYGSSRPFGVALMNAVSTLKEDYVENMALNEGVVMAAKILGKSMDMNKPDSNRFEIGVITLDENKKVVQRRVEGAELDKVLADAKVFDNM